jgi:hypothetical protein
MRKRYGVRSREKDERVTRRGGDGARGRPGVKEQMRRQME